MATLLKTTGETREVQPADGVEFTLQELQGYVGGLIEAVYLDDGRLM